MESAEHQNDDDADGAIEVDLTQPEDKQVSRRTAAVKVTRAQPNKADDWAEKSKAVKRRLSGMQRSFDQRLAEQQADFQRQISERDKRIDALEAKRTDTTSTDEATHEAAMAKLQSDMEDAQERGDSKGAAAIAREMAKREGQYWAAKTSKQTGGTSENTARTANGDGRQQQAAAGAARPTGPAPTKAGIAWAKANTDWWDDKVDETCVAARGFANAIYAKKLAEGEDNTDPEFYEDIRKKVAKRFPELETVTTLKGRRQADPGDDDDDDDDGDDARGGQEQDRKGRLPVSTIDRGNANQRRGNSQRITAREQEEMRKVNLDPLNNKHVLQYIRERNEMENQA